MSTSASYRTSSTCVTGRPWTPWRATLSTSRAQTRRRSKCSALFRKARPSTGSQGWSLRSSTSHTKTSTFASNTRPSTGKSRAGRPRAGASTSVWTSRSLGSRRQVCPIFCGTRSATRTSSSACTESATLNWRSSLTTCRTRTPRWFISGRNATAPPKIKTGSSSAVATPRCSPPTHWPCQNTPKRGRKATCQPRLPGILRAKAAAPPCRPPMARLALEAEAGCARFLAAC
mmetsp:Transcript_831/g.2443  ORF Transcript_831/g.2443 Transcript_831/m.2443 type:complete len:231 (-) Transcript_831:635-1327(-)